MIARLSVSLFFVPSAGGPKASCPERKGRAGKGNIRLLVGCRHEAVAECRFALWPRRSGKGAGWAVCRRENRVGSVGGFFRTHRGVGPVGKCGPSLRTPATGWENWGFGMPIRRMRTIVDSDAASGKLVRFLLDRKRGDRAEIVIFARRICRNFIS